MELSPGVREEFEIAKRLRRFVIPVAATGYVAKDLWTDIMDDIGAFFPGIDVRKSLEQLENPNTSVEKLTDAIFKVLGLVVQSRE